MAETVDNATQCYWQHVHGVLFVPFTFDLLILGAILMSELEPVHLQEDQATGDRFLVYGADSGPQVEIYYEGEELWMTQAQIADLYGRDVSTISRHISNVLEEGELDGSNLHKTQIASSTKPVALYSLDMVISVGYRVSSKQATLFRRWATDKLVQFATKGFVVDATRLKSPDYRNRVSELRDIIRDIRCKSQQWHQPRQSW